MLPSLAEDSQVRPDGEIVSPVDSLFRQGERVRGPHVIECHANINRVKIRQVIHFPNGMERDFVVESTSKASEMVANICRELKFLPDSATGLSLYLETGKKRKNFAFFANR